nr:nucleotide-binding alpha-beta plait domain-containing protein [Tanacetum cinerariifolium]GFA09575.1 nucleotide-binding alpha-beta plait domain-containing protein [Tanacetum cinerariifolium]
MRSHKSKEDDVSKISTSIFITNFSDSFSAKELFNSCKQYGYVVDVFIPTKRSKVGKRFGFVRFTNVLNEERLVNNLCTTWVGRFKLHANIVRHGVKWSGYSYVHVVKGKTPFVNTKSDPTPALVLDDECLNSTDLYNSLLYMGKLWVLLEFALEDSKKLFHANVGVGSWFSQLIQASMDFIIEGRIVWVEIEDDNCLYSKRLCINTKVGNNIMESFKIIFRGKVSWIRAKEVTRWVLEFLDESDDEHDSDDDSKK